MSSIWVRTVIFVGEQCGATGSHVIGSDVTESNVTGSRVTERVPVRKFRNNPSGAFSPEVTSVTGSYGVRMRNRYILYYY